MPAPIDIVARPPAMHGRSNLTSQLLAAGAQSAIPTSSPAGPGARPGSVSQNSGIPIANRLRRESSTIGQELARSLMGGNGMSLGYNGSFGSWIRDDIMTGTSPFPTNSPSLQSDSYLPKLEADFIKDFTCCGIQLPTLHDLLMHYEKRHAQHAEETQKEVNTERVAQRMHSNAGLKSPIGGNVGLQLDTMSRQQHARQRQDEELRAEEDDHQESEIAGDMEMDDVDTPPPTQTHSTHPSTPSTMNHPSQRNSPTMGYQLSTTQSRPQLYTPDSSEPNSPTGGNFEYNKYPQDFQSNKDLPQNYHVDYLNSKGEDTEMACIDQPAKRLFTPGGQYSPGYIQRMYNNGGNFDYNSLADGPMPNVDNQYPIELEVHKPYQCPVIGCEKAYKNQNGLKYHKTHGHKNQELHDNGDGSFSIMNPDTHRPYPGTVGMEKEKPYYCEGCGKRYKNLNGLKYHRKHATPTRCKGIQVQPPPMGVVAVAGIDSYRGLEFDTGLQHM